jgi:hypothetical protein
MIEYGGLHKVKKQDWIILRLLFLMLTLDPTMIKVDEIQWTMRYLRGRYKYWDQDIILHAFPELSYEHGQRGTFQDKHKDVKLFRDFAKTLIIERSGDEDKDVQERRFFGSTSTILRQGNTNG